MATLGAPCGALPRSLGQFPRYDLLRRPRPQQCHIQRPLAMTANMAAMNINWPISALTLKNSSAIEIDGPHVLRKPFDTAALEAAIESVT